MRATAMTTHPRQDWNKAFRAMTACGDDALLDEEVTEPTEWDKTEWTWPDEPWISAMPKST